MKNTHFTFCKDEGEKNVWLRELTHRLEGKDGTKKKAKLYNTCVMSVIIYSNWNPIYFSLS